VSVHAFVPAASSRRPQPPALGSLAPDLHWTDANGSRCSLRALRGQPVVVAFFPASWDPARAEQLEQYNALLRKLPGGGELVGVTSDPFWFDAATESGERVRFPLLHEPAGESEWARSYGVTDQQATFVVDSNGIVRWRHIAASGVQPSLDELFEAMQALDGGPGITRRDFLLTTIAFTLAATVPVAGHAQGTVRSPEDVRAATTTLNA